VDESYQAASEVAFRDAWREQLLAKAWDALATFERATGQPVHTVLRLRADRPDSTAEGLAALLATALGREVDGGWVRKRVHLARRKFAELLVEEVRQTIDPSDPGGLTDELMDLGLYDYCREAGRNAQ
jgi:hypothetical protein